MKGSELSVLLIDRILCPSVIFLYNQENTKQPSVVQQSHTSTVTKGGGVDGPPLGFLICYFISKRFYFEYTACDVLYKIRYMLWVAALLGACGVNQDGSHLVCHLGFNPKLEVIKNGGKWHVFMLEMRALIT